MIFCNMSSDILKFMNKKLSSGILNPNDENYFALKVLDISRTSVIEQKNIEPKERYYEMSKMGFVALKPSK